MEQTDLETLLDEAFEDGRAAGFEAGKESAALTEFDRGYNRGFEDGQAQGWNQGREIAFQEIEDRDFQEHLTAHWNS